MYELDEMVVSIDLVGNGVAAVYLEGVDERECPHGKVHRQEVNAEVHVGSDQCRHDLDDLEWAIRGSVDAAERVADGLLRDLWKYDWGDPCNQVQENV